jgi:hypothetical protein
MRWLLLLLALVASDGWSAVSPPVTSGLKLLLQSDAGVTLNGSKVAVWEDQSGNGNNCWFATDANRPIYETNKFDGRPWLRNSGGLGLTSTASIISGSNPMTVMLLQESFPSSDNTVSFGLGPQAGCQAFAVAGQAIWGWIGSCDISAAGLSFGDIGGNVVKVHTQTWTGVNAVGAGQRYSNKTSIGAHDGRAWNIGAGYTLFSLNGIQFDYTRSIVDIAVFDRVLSQAERESMVDWMLTRAGGATVTAPSLLSPYLRQVVSPRIFPPSIP